MVAMLGTACVPKDTIDQSPLVTWDPSSSDVFHDATVGDGTLSISSGCVLLILENEKKILLVWPEPTSWNPSSQTIQFVGVRGESLELRDGDRIMPGGSAPPGEEEQVSPPDGSCGADELFIVNSVQIVAD